MARAIVLDASVLIAFLDANDRHHDAATTLLADAIDDELCVNSLMLAEVLVAPVRADRLSEVQRALDDLEIRELLFPASTAKRLAEVRVNTGLKMPDCCVLLAATEAGASIATFDERLAQVAERQGIAVVPAPI